ncbi:MAG: glucokinase [Rubrivivax sp.]
MNRSLPGPWLVADIGGTNARFGWQADGDAALTHVRKLRGADHAGPQEAARAYLDDLKQTLGDDWAAPRVGAFAVATATGEDRVAFTNSDWSFSRRETCAALGLSELLVLNDFEALALSLPGLKPQQVRRFGGGKAMPGAALAVLGPGTGLGVAGLVQTAGGLHVAVPGEGGHATLAASDDFEAAVLAAARHLHGHVSAERLLSGIGMPTLHAAVAAVLGQTAPRLETPEIVRRGIGQPDGGSDREHGSRIDDSKDNDGSEECGDSEYSNAPEPEPTAAVDPLCRRTLDTFCALLGSFAGNVALTFGARGGVYIGGGIVPRLGRLFFDSDFRQRFEAKGRLDDYLQAVPTAVITDTLAALEGAAHALAQARHRSGR